MWTWVLTFVERKRFPDTDNNGVLLQVVQYGAVRVPDDVDVETLADTRLSVILHPWAPANVTQDHHADIFLSHFPFNLWNRNRLRRSHFQAQRPVNTTDDRSRRISMSQNDRVILCSQDLGTERAAITDRFEISN